MNQHPRSIFTGSDSPHEPPLHNSSRRLSTPEYRATLALPLPAVPVAQGPRSDSLAGPSTAASLSSLPSLSFHPPPSWTQTYGSVERPKSPTTSPAAAAAAAATAAAAADGPASSSVPSSQPLCDLPSPCHQQRHRPSQHPHPPPQHRPKKRSLDQADIPVDVDVGTGDNNNNKSTLLRSPAVVSLHKRRKLPRGAYKSLDLFDFPLVHHHTSDQPPSPLFFSNSRRRARPQLPARFSSSEAAARMLSKARGEEDAPVKTVTLARGTPSTLASNVTSAARYARSSSDRSSILRTSSSDASDKNDPNRLLSSLGVVELLDHDPRPTFVVDLQNPHNYEKGAIPFLFSNVALRANGKLLELISGASQLEDTADEATVRSLSRFKSWIFSAVVAGEALELVLPSTEFSGLIWSCTTLRKRLRLVSGTYAPAMSSSTNARQTLEKLKGPLTPAPPLDTMASLSSDLGPSPLSQVDNVEAPDYFGALVLPNKDAMEMSTPADAKILPSAESGSEAISTRVLDDQGRIFAPGEHPSLTNEAKPERETGFFDWTRLSLSDALPRHIQFARSIDWASTSLGPIEEWSADLRQMCNLIMASPHPAAMYWGDDLVAIYNEAYVLLAGQKHPRLMGQSYREAWSEIWDDVKDVFASARLTGQATMKDDDCLFINRHEYLEETYFSWSIIPMVGGDGTVMGLYNPAFEKTRRKIAERRMLTLREVGERTASARDVKSFWERVHDALQTNELDAPFVLLYSVSDDSDSDSSSIYSNSLIGTRRCYLEGAVGVESGHACAPSEIELKSGMDGFGPAFREVMKTDKPVVLDVGSKDLPISMMQDIEWKGFGDSCRAVVICPIHPTTGEGSILGFLVMGVNPRRPYDDDYSLFIQLLSRQLATSLASVVLFEEEIRRGQRAAKLAALDRMELSEQLAIRTQEAKENETRFSRMAEFSPAGLFIANSEGHVTYCNDTWYEISRVAKDERSTDRWIDAVKEEDQPMVKRLWAELVDQTKPITAEFRFKAPWEDRNGNRGDTWVLFSAFPEVYEQGILKSVFGCLTNISQQKWAEDFQKRKMEEAVELKRQQENFIDITSHEMRNPLSAILQCADEISTTLTEFKKSGSPSMDMDLVNTNIDSAQTIGLCALHQKRIVDDILTLSKIDSAILHVTPVDVQPLAVMKRALKMYENEVTSAKIRLDFVVEDSFKSLEIDWVKMDPSRVLQVLINLTGNAIKFTTTEERKAITIRLGASKIRPSQAKNAPVEFFKSRGKPSSQNGPDWGDGEEIFLQFVVEDTGRGLNEAEKKLLFMRFSQASPRTHVQYGGSGLGLFISRELTELQGGEIGVASEAGVGSTFAFYIACRRSVSPPSTSIELPSTLPLSTPSKATSSKPRATDFAASSNQAGTGKTIDRSHIQILIVEDNLVNQKVLQNQLKRNGFSTLVANHGGEALEKLEGSNFWHTASADAFTINIVLMDQEMPVMDGLRCTREIRKLEKDQKLRGHVPIIGVTANARQEQIDNLLDAGMDDVMPKPFTIPDLIPKIEQLCSQHPYVGVSSTTVEALPASKRR